MRVDQRSHLSLGEVLGSASLCEQGSERRDARIYCAGMTGGAEFLACL